MDEYVISDATSVDHDVLTYRMKNITRKSGARVIIIFADAIEAAKILFAGDESIMGVSGYV